MKVPFVDLKKQYETIKPEIDEAVENVISETAFIKGKYVSEFEDEFSNLYGVENFISCANGTDAIYIALKSLGVGPGDEVITVANTWISTAETISQCGAKPVFVDTNPDFYTIDHELIEQKITSKTKAIIPVHLYGQACDMEFISELCKNYNLYLIEDCAQAHFAQWNSKNVGTYGDAATFSFFPGKNLGAYGDAGGIVTQNQDLAKKMRMFANHGALVKHEHKIEGINSRLDGIQAAILSAKLPYILKWTDARNSVARKYIQLFESNSNIVCPKINDLSKHAFHLFVVRTDERESLINFLNGNNISTGIHYPTPLPFLEAYSYLNHKPEDFPVAYDFMNKILSLPIYPEITDDQINFIVSKVEEFFI